MARSARLSSFPNQRRAETMGVADFTSMLANAAFAARLAGETEESLTDGD